jgi:hypothetical protein
VFSNKEKIVICRHYRSRIALHVFIVKNQASDHLKEGFHGTVERCIPEGREDGNSEGSKILRRIELVTREEKSEILNNFTSPAGGNREDWPGIIEGSAFNIAPKGC